MIKIKKIKVESTPVFDLTVESTHSFFANNILVHNCQEIAEPTSPFKSVKDLYKETYEDGDGEIALCNIAGIIVPNIESDEQYADAAYYALKMIDKTVHMTDYIFPALAHTAKARMNAGVGILGLAHLMAKKNMSYRDQAGLNFIHELSETHMWHLINASLKLGKELGNAPWMHKTKWPEGWLPLDTYEKRVDELVTVENKRDWASLKAAIIENKGIRNSVVSAHMPGESSTIAAGTVNSLYPLREFSLIKTSDTLVNHWVAPDSTRLKNKYEIAWNISTTEMIRVYAIVQKWTDQSISADLFVNLQGDQKVSSSSIVQDYLDMVKYGMKSRYYVNSLTGGGIDLKSTETAVNQEAIQQEPEESRGCSSGACSL